MAEDIKFVEEAPESQPSVREKLAWVPGYPRDRLDEFLDNIALLVSQAREQANLAETRAGQATLEAYNAAASRQAAASSALESLGYKQAASKSAGDSATEADRSNEEADRAASEADRAKREADRSVQTIADHLAANDPHPVYIRKELPAGATVKDQFVFTTEGFRKLVVEGGIKITRYKQEQLSQALGWNDPKLLIEGDYVLEVNDFLNGPELETGFTESGGWWYLSTRMISSGYYVQNAYSDFGDICIRYVSTEPNTPPGKWVVFANSSAYCKTRQRVISGPSEGYSKEYQLSANDLRANHLVISEVSAGFGIRLPTNVGKVNGMETSAKFFITNNTKNSINIVTWEPEHVLNGNKVSVSIPAFTTAILINLGNAWEWSVFGFGLGGGANAPTFLGRPNTVVKNYTKHRIMRVNGLESEGVEQLFLLPVEGDGWIDISVDHTWKTNGRGEISTPLVLVAPAGETISTNDGDFAAVRILYRNDLTAFRYEGQWRINDCAKYVLPPVQHNVVVSSIIWTNPVGVSDLMPHVKQIPDDSNGERWWISWNFYTYQISHTVNEDIHNLEAKSVIYLTDKSSIVPTIKCLTVHWDEATKKPVFYAIGASASGNTHYLIKGSLDKESRVITWNSLSVFAAAFQNILATDSGFVVAIGDDGTNIYELRYHPSGIAPVINTYPSSQASNSNHNWGLATVVRGNVAGENDDNVHTVTLKDGSEATWFYNKTDTLVFSTTDGVAVLYYRLPTTGYDLVMNHNQLDGPYYTDSEFQTFCFDHYQSCLCYGRDQDTSKVWYRMLTDTTAFETDFYASNGKLGIRMFTLEWDLQLAKLPTYVAMIGDEFIVGLCPATDKHYFKTKGLKPGTTDLYIPDYLAATSLETPTFGASWSNNPVTNREGDLKFYYRTKKAFNDDYGVLTGTDPGVYNGMSEAGIFERM